MQSTLVTLDNAGRQRLAKTFAIPPNMLDGLDKFQKLRPELMLVKDQSRGAGQMGEGLELRFVLDEQHAWLRVAQHKMVRDSSTVGSVDLKAQNVMEFEMHFSNDYVMNCEDSALEMVFQLKELVDARKTELADWRFPQYFNLALYMDCLLTPEDRSRQAQAKAVRQKLCANLQLDYPQLMAALVKAKAE